MRSALVRDRQRDQAMHAPRWFAPRTCRRYGPPRSGSAARRRPFREGITRNRVVDIFDEVNDDLRAERAKLLFRRYGGVFVAVLLLILAGAGGFEAWRWYGARNDTAAAIDYLAAMTLADALPANADAKARAPAIAAFEHVVATAPVGYRSLARLRLAALQAGAGDQAAAAATWNALAADGSADPLLRDLANLLWAQQNVDKGDPALVEARLKPLTYPGNAWRPIALEYLALLDIRTGKIDAARTILRPLSVDFTAPQGLRGRAGALLERLGN